MANRPKRTEKKDEKFFDALRKGHSVSAAGAISGYKRRTLYEWKEADKAFHEEWEAALQEGTDLLEDEVMRRAMSGHTEPVFYQGKECGAVRKYSDTLAIFMLKARRPEKYRERVDVDHGVQPDNPLTAILREISGTTLRPSDDPSKDEEANG